MTERKTVIGTISDRYSARNVPITVRFTSDILGESLSLTYDNQIMLYVNFEDIVPMIEKVRAKK